MANALALLRGLGHKVKSPESPEHLRSLLLEIPSPRPVDIEFTDISLNVSCGFRKEKKTILKGISGKFRSGDLTAIMGPSGAGKSSLLNALTGFSTEGITGKIRVGENTCIFGSKNQSLTSYSKQSCYILQDDQLNPLFTVFEIMNFAADLKLGKCLTKKAKESVIHEILETLGLLGTQNTRCSRLSGGQRKRLSIALELIDNPPVLFLDEPTTGLDSLTSAQCVELLKSIARGGRTVVCTIHQPTASIYSLFDQVYILADGYCIYQGESLNTVPYLASVGLQCPKYHNPADYILEVANGEYGNFNEQLSHQSIKKDWRKNNSPSLTNNIEKGNVFACGKTIVLISPPDESYKFFVLMRRFLIQLYRDWTVTHLKIILHSMIGLLLGLIYQNAGNDGSRTVSNAGYLMITVVYLCYTSLMPAVLRFPEELPVLKKENFNNWYNLKTYYAAALVTSMPSQIIYSLVYCGSSYFMSGQPPELNRFLMFVGMCSLITLIADAVGNVIGTCVNAINGTFLGAILTCTMFAFAGYLSRFADMPKFMYYISFGSFLRYGMEGLIVSIYGYDRSPFNCPDEEIYCHYKYPDLFIKELWMNDGFYHYDALVLIVKLLIFRVLAYYTLRRNVKTAN